MRMKTILALAVASPLLAASVASASHESRLSGLTPWLQEDGWPAGDRRKTKVGAPKATAGAHRRDGAQGNDARHSYRHAPDFADYD